MAVCVACVCCLCVYMFVCVNVCLMERADGYNSDLRLGCAVVTKDSKILAPTTAKAYFLFMMFVSILG